MQSSFNHELQDKKYHAWMGFHPKHQIFAKYYPYFLLFHGRQHFICTFMTALQNGTFNCLVEKEMG